MHARWESSTRPMFVRSVWCSGYRHPVLTPNDPLVKAEKHNTHAANKTGESGHKKNGQKVPSRRLLLRQMPQSENRFLISNNAEKPRIGPEKAELYDSDAEEDSFKNTKHRQNARDRANNRRAISAKQTEALYEKIDSTKDRVIKSYLKHQNTYPICDFDLSYLNVLNVEENEKNPLSERVLQWLDLAGKCNTKMEQKYIKRMQDDENNVISKDAVKTRATSVQHYKINIRTQMFEGDLDKANGGRTDVENGNDVKNKRRNSVQVITPRSSSNASPLFLRHLKNQAQCNNRNNSRTKSEVRSDENGVSEVKRSADDSANDQVVLAGSNSQITKKQLHIFMPSLPTNRRLYIDNESCLSTIPSEV